MSVHFALLWWIPITSSDETLVSDMVLWRQFLMSRIEKLLSLDAEVVGRASAMLTRQHRPGNTSICGPTKAGSSTKLPTVSPTFFFSTNLLAYRSSTSKLSTSTQYSSATGLKVPQSKKFAVQWFSADIWFEKLLISITEPWLEVCKWSLRGPGLHNTSQVSHRCFLCFVNFRTILPCRHLGSRGSSHPLQGLFFKKYMDLISNIFSFHP